MKFKHFNSIAAILLFFLFSATIYSQTTQSAQLIDIKKNKIKVKDDVLVIDFDIILHGISLPANNQMVLTPILYSKYGEKHTLQLRSVVVNGKKRNGLYKRSLSLNGLGIDPNVYSVSVTPKDKALGTIHYDEEIPFEPWMDEANVYLIKDMSGCCDVKYGHNELLVSEGISYQGTFDYTYTPAVNFMAPPHESIKRRAEAGEAYLYFKQGKSEILPELFDNKTELAKINNSLQYVKDEPEAVIQALTIKAYASPEGLTESNLALSKRRAGELLTYVTSKNNFSSKVRVVSEGLGEDWDKLATLVEEDNNVPNKIQVLGILKTPLAGRKKLLEDLDGGKPYAYLLNTLYPRLRRSDYNIEYTLPTFSLDKGKELLKTKPRMLSLDEMYIIANTYPQGSQEFCDVFEIAQKVYPDDMIANINAAATAILMGNEEHALSILEKYKREPAAWNNLGVIYMNQQQFEEAQTYFTRAISEGNQEAEQNLKILTELKAALDEYNN
ncbi:MAG: DUF3868 domain-containing protein [Candidatus Symbiothrix sp.]|jgi:tetratricopeptide (TPR) repeat protein|nr:DUF3868 domain-containing protein [Candidatus Symbiothrix sp.]